jgi:hypothetical protein
MVPGLLKLGGLTPVALTAIVMVLPWPAPSPRAELGWSWLRAHRAVYDLTLAVVFGSLLAPLGPAAAALGCALWLLLPLSTLDARHGLAAAALAGVLASGLALGGAHVVGAPWTLLQPAWDNAPSWLGPAVVTGLLMRVRPPTDATSSVAPTHTAALTGLLGIALLAGFAHESLPDPVMTTAWAAFGLGATLPASRPDTADAWLLRAAGAATIALVGGMAPLVGAWWLTLMVPLFFAASALRSVDGWSVRLIVALPWLVSLLASHPLVPNDVGGSVFAATILSLLVWTAGLWTLRYAPEAR